MIATPDDAARDWLCPLARTFADPKTSLHCRGPACAAWRWIPVDVTKSTEWKSAVAAEIERMNAERASPAPAGALAAKAAVAVYQSRVALGLPEHSGVGYCGAGGAPIR